MKKSAEVINEMMTCTCVTDRDFDQEVLESDTPVLVIFGAPWCGTCHIIAPAIKDFASSYKGKVKICKMDIDENKKVAATYGIREVPTLLFFSRGSVVDHIFGAVPKRVIESKLRAMVKAGRGSRTKKSIQRSEVLEEKGGVS